jgi:hypothetical protein
MDELADLLHALTNTIAIDFIRKLVLIPMKI